MADYDRVTARIAKVPGVVRAAPVVDGQVMASQNNANLGVIVRGIRAPRPAKLSVAQKLRAGSLPYFDGDDAVIVGSGLAASWACGWAGNHADCAQGQCHALRHQRRG